VRAIEDQRSGAYNATGPRGGPLDWPTLIEACIAAARGRAAPPLATVAVAEDFLLANGVAPWNELPLWVPSNDAERVGFARVDCSRAFAAGLVTRPLADTVDAVLDEAGGLVADDPRLRGKLGRAREAELIARWRGQQSAAADADSATTTEGAA
jgi:2'-hydroxyisoflavone reductase